MYIQILCFVIIVKREFNRAVPLALGMLYVGDPSVPIMDTLSKLTHDADAEVAQVRPHVILP